MNKIVLIGLNHKSAPVELRECLAFSGDEIAAGLEILSNVPSLEEVLLYSTCNRVEVLAVAGEFDAAETAVKSFLSDFKKVPLARFDQSLYMFQQEEAVRHLFRVAASLDSMMVGEPQILGQVKASYKTANAMKCTGVVLNKLLHRAFSIAKRVRTETGIGDHAVSISYAAIELGRKIFGSLEGKKVLLIGAGEMAELAVEHLIRQKAFEVCVANRTFERGVSLARRYHGTPIRFEEISAVIQDVDIVISSTGSESFVVTYDHVKSVMRKRRNQPVFFIDIAVPRDIDPRINKLVNAYVYDIDDLKSVIDDNIQERRSEAVKGERIVDEGVILFMEWYQRLALVPTIIALKNKAETIAAAEMERTLKVLKHLSKEDQEAMSRMVRSMVGKIVHDPIQFLKNRESHGSRSHYVDIVRQIFNLEE